MENTKALEVARGLPANEYLAMRSTGPFYVVEGKYGPYFYDAAQQREMNLIDVVLTLNHYFHELAKWDKLGGMLLLCGEQECRDVKGYPDKLRALIDGLITLRAQLAKRNAQLAALRKFAQWAIKEGPWNGCNLDGFEIQEKAEELGLVEKRIANESNGDEWQHIDGVEEIGDPFYVFTSVTRQPTQDKGE